MNKKILFSLSTAYLLLAFLILPHYQFFIYDDAVSYINIAQKYASGHFAEAINGYWSPLYSLLMVPFLLMHVAPLLAAKLVPIISGLGVLIALGMFTGKLLLERKITFAILASAIPLLLFFAFTELSPDLLTTCLLLFYFYCILDKQYPERPLFGAFAGIVGGLLYLSKSYGFYFFIAHFIIFNISQYFASEKRFFKGIVANFFLGTTMILLISAPWIAAISEKYGDFTLSTVGGINFATVVAPDRPSPGYPMKYEGLLPPPDQFSVSVWDDPSYLSITKWSPFKSPHDLLYFTKHTFFNVLGAYEILAAPSPVFPFLAVVLLLIMLSRLAYSSSKELLNSVKRLFYEHDLVMWLAISLAIYLGGYLLVLVQPRYLWIIFFALLLMGGALLQKLFLIHALGERGKTVILFFLWVLIATIPLVKLEFGAGQGRDIYALSASLRDLGVGGNIASDPQPGTMQNYQKTEIVSYLLGAKYFGEPRSRDGASLVRELKEHHIDYYLVWNGGAGTILAPGDFTEIAQQVHPELRIYRSIGVLRSMSQ